MDESQTVYDEWRKEFPSCPFCRSTNGYSLFTNPRWFDKHVTCGNCGATWYIGEGKQRGVITLEKISEASKYSVEASRQLVRKEQTLDFWKNLAARVKEQAQRHVVTTRQNIENFMKAGRYDDAAALYERLGEWEKAGECRTMAKTSYVIAADVHLGEDGISVKCPYCSSAERLESKTSEVRCKHCGKEYFIPKKILDMI